MAHQNRNSGPKKPQKKTGMEEVEVKLHMSPATRRAIKELAKMTGAKNFAKFSQDCYRIIEWIIYRQAVKGLTIVGLPPAAIEFLKKYPEDITCESLMPLVISGKEAEVKKYFDEAASSGKE